MKKFNFKKYALMLLIVLIIILIFTLADFLIHTLSEEYSVPGYYFRNKIIFGTLIGFVTYFFVGKMKLWKKALIFSLAVSVLLQIRYFIEGYPLDFVLEFLFIHFIILLPVSWGVFYLFRKYM